MSMYDNYRAIRQPEVHRTWREGVKRQQTQVAVLAVLLLVGVGVLLASPAAGVLIMIAAGVALLGTVVAGRYFA